MRPTQLKYATHVIDCIIQNNVSLFCLEGTLVNRVRPAAALIRWNSRQINDALLPG